MWRKLEVGKSNEPEVQCIACGMWTDVDGCGRVRSDYEMSTENKHTQTWINCGLNVNVRKSSKLTRDGKLVVTLELYLDIRSTSVQQVKHRSIHYFGAFTISNCNSATTDLSMVHASTRIPNSSEMINALARITQ
jgi:hypothetical protein